MTMDKLDRTKRPEVHQFAELAIAPQQVIDLDNGVTLHYIDNGDQPIVRVTVMWNRGKADYAPGAIASFLPALMKEGVADMSGRDIAELIDFEGSWLKTRVDSHYSGVELLCLEQSLPKLVDLLSKLVTSPTLPDSAFSALRQKAVAEAKVKLTRVSVLSQTALRLLMAGKSHAYTKFNTPDAIAAIQREQLTGALDKISESKIHIFVGGRLNDDIKELIERLAHKIRPTHATENQSSFCLDKPDNVGVYHIMMAESLQSSISIGIPVIGRDNPDYIPLRLTVMALGGYFGSRLMTNIREDKGLTYGISAQLNGTFEGAHVAIHAQCDAKYTAQVISETKAEILKLANEPMADDELKRLKQYMSTSLAATLDSPLSITDYYINNLIVGTPKDYFEAQFRIINNLTSETIMEMAKRYLTVENMRIVVAGPTAPDNGVSFDFNSYL